MRRLNNTYLLSFLPASLKYEGSRKRYLYWLTAVSLLMIGLELTQDIISASLNSNHFSIVDSLSYKLFWPLFIPFATILIHWWHKAKSNFSSATWLFLNACIILSVTLVHLVVFSFLLFGISSLVYNDPWSIYYLLTEKLSTRLYIGLAFYILLFVVYHYRVQKHAESTSAGPVSQKHPEHIVVKNGKRSVLVDIELIKWIKADGQYLSVITPDNKYVVLDSLKNIIRTLPSNFIRIHRSTIANIEKVNELKSRGNGDYDLVMEDKETLRLSRTYAKSVKKSLL